MNNPFGRITIRVVLITVWAALSSSCTVAQRSAPPAGPDNQNTGFERYAEAVPDPFKADAAAFYRNISYGPGEPNKVDLMMPEGEGPFPVLIYFHGGGFIGGNKEMIYKPRGGNDVFFKTAQEAVKAGVAVASANYTKLNTPLNQGVISALQDGQRVVKFLRFHADNLNLFPDRIAVFGGSAGGGIALWVATTEEDIAREIGGGEAEYLGVSPSVTCAAAYNSQATYDLVKWFADVFTDYNLDRNQMIVGKEVKRVKAFYSISSVGEMNGPEGTKYREAVDMMHLLDAGDPPIWMGSPKTSAPDPANFQDMFHHPAHVRALKARSDRLDIPTGKNHFVVPAYDIRSPDAPLMHTFLIDHLKK